MTVADLIDQLRLCPQSAVVHLYTGTGGVADFVRIYRESSRAPGEKEFEFERVTIHSEPHPIFEARK